MDPLRKTFIIIATVLAASSAPAMAFGEDPEQLVAVTMTYIKACKDLTPPVPKATWEFIHLVMHAHKIDMDDERFQERAALRAITDPLTRGAALGTDKVATERWCHKVFASMTK